MNDLFSSDNPTILLEILGGVLPTIIYFLIFFYLIFVTIKRVGKTQKLVYFFFSLFFLMCGIAQIYSLISIWYPLDLISSILKILVIIASLGTIIILIGKHRDLLDFLSSLQLILKENRQLSTEILSYKANEKEFFIKKQLLNAVILNAPIGLATVGLDGNWLTVNQALCQMLGYTEAELVGTNFQSITHPDDLQKKEELIDQLSIPGTHKSDIEKRYKHKAGHYIWGWVSASFFKDTNGKPIYFITQIIDITERKKIRTKLTQSENRFRQLINSAPIGMGTVGLDGSWLTVNQALCQMLGYTEAELLAINVEKIIHPDDLQRREELIHQLSIPGIHKSDIEKRYKHKAGHYMWGWVSASFFKDANGKPVYFITQIIDITERKKMEIELEQSEKKIRQLMNLAPIGMATLDLNGCWLTVNQALCQMLGYTETELLGTNFQSITHPDDLQKKDELMQQLLTPGINKFELEKRYLHKKGHYIWGWLSVSYLKDTEGKKMGSIAQIIDVSKKKTTEKKLRRTEKLFQQTTRYAPIGKSLLDVDFNWKMVNHALCKILGYTEKELLEKNIMDLCHPEDKDIGKELFIQLMTRKIPNARIEKRHLHKNGSILWIGLNATVIWDKDKFLYLLVQWTNITPIKNKEAEITELNMQLETKIIARTSELQESNRELENFTYVLTHDLRQPLKNMSNLSSLIKEDYSALLDKEGVYMLNMIEKNAQKVDTLIVDMMNYSKSTKADFERKTIDLHALFHEAFEDCKLLYETKVITFKVNELPLVIGDKIALLQVCLNLISNALKYSSKKEQIKIEVDCYKENETAVFSIRDNGTGFDNTLSHKIFEVFQRLHKSSEFEGTGIGMPIAAKIIEKHGGEIWAKGKVGEGAIFYFTLPLY